MANVNIRKAAMIGCGFVGSASVYAMMQSGVFSEIVLIDANRAKAEGEAMDIAHGVAFAKPTNIYAGTYDDIQDAAVIIISAGAAQKPGETRLDLVHKNVGIFKSIIPEIAKRRCEGVILVVANPVDILTYAALKMSGFPAHRVIGSGTVLDSARFQYLLSEHLEIDARDINAYIIGEHGDSEIAAWSIANIAGIPIHNFCEMRGFRDHEKETTRIAEEVKNSAYTIIEKKGATYYGIGMSVTRIAEAIVRDEKAILPISTLLTGHYGIENICLSIPTIVGVNGAEAIAPFEIDEKEQQALYQSSVALRKVIDEAL